MLLNVCVFVLLPAWGSECECCVGSGDECAPCAFTMGATRQPTSIAGLGHRVQSER